MATRRNRIKAVINVTRNRPVTHSDRPLTPIPSNANHNVQEPMSPGIQRPMSPGGPISSYSPSSPVKGDRGKSPSMHLPPSSSLLRSLSPSPSKLVTSLELARSPGGRSVSPNKRPPTPASSYTTLHSPPYSGTTAADLRSPPSSSSCSYPFSPPGGFQRPSPAQSPSFSRQYSSAPVYSLGPAGSGGIQRPSPASSPARPSPVTSPVGSGGILQRPSPVNSPTYHNYENSNRSKSFLAPHSFNTNSNSADSHEVARYMSTPGVSENKSMDQDGQRSITPSSSSVGKGAFSSVAKDKQQQGQSSGQPPAPSPQDPLLRHRLQKPSPALTVSKYHTLRKEFMNKVHTVEPEQRNKLTMLHFAFWNPPNPKGKDDVPGSRNNRASSVCSDRGRSKGKSSLSDHDPNSRNSLPDVESGNKARRATIDTVSISSHVSKKDKDDDQALSDTESTTSSKSSNNNNTKTSIGPRVKVGPDGQLIIDEQSLVVETSESQRAKKQLSEMETVSGADFTVGSSGLFRNKKQVKRGTDWSIKETVKFYRGLSLCGTDFSMMSTIFKNRSRAELKSKFKREDRRNPGQISEALSCQEFDPDEGISSSGDSDYEEDPNLPVNTKSKKLPRKKIFGKQLTEQERLLNEEIEMEEATFSITAQRSPPQKRRRIKHSELPPLEKEKNENHNLKLGRPRPSWKSTAIIDEVKTEGRKKSNRKEMIVEEKKKTKPRIKKKKKKAKEIIIVDEPPPLTMTTRSKDAVQVTVNVMDSIDILRFDASDPLGLKVVKVNTRRASRGGLEPPGSSDIVTLTPVDLSTRRNSISSGGRISPISFVKNFEQDKNTAAVTSRVVKNERDKPKNNKVKGMPYRVPGPGGGPVQSPSLVDEIEIEISCQ